MGYKISLQNTFSWALLAFVLLIPANNSFEVLAMMKGELEYGAWSDPITPLYIKLIKDLFLILVVFLGFFKVVVDERMRRLLFFGNFFLSINLFMVFLIFISALSLAFFPLELIVVGVRAYWTLLLVYVGACFFNFNEKIVVNVFLSVFVVHLLMQVFQFSMGSGYAVFAENRNPGIFIVPTTAGAFSILAYYFAGLAGRPLFKFLALLSMILSASTIAALVFFSYFLFKLFYSFRRYYELYLVFLVIAVGAFFFIFSNLDFVSGRGDGAYQSLYTRLGYITTVLGDFQDLAFGRGMGIATSQAVMAEMEGAVVADNTFTGMMLNLGWVALVPLLIFVLSSFFVFEDKILFFLLIGFSMVANMFEMSPVVQVLMILLGQQAARKHFSRDGVGGTCLRTKVECS